MNYPQVQEYQQLYIKLQKRIKLGQSKTGQVEQLRNDMDRIWYSMTPLELIQCKDWIIAYGKD